MKKILDAADKFTQYALAGVLTLFAVACVFGGCQVSNGKAETTPAVVQETETTSLIVEENKPEFFDLGEFKLTAYCACEKCCGKSDGITASGAKVQQGITIAADTDILPFGTNVIINGHEYTVQDRGGAIKGNRIDIYFDSHEDALEFGVQKAEVYKVVS